MLHREDKEYDCTLPQDECWRYIEFKKIYILGVKSFGKMQNPKSIIELDIRLRGILKNKVT